MGPAYPASARSRRLDLDLPKWASLQYHGGSPLRRPGPWRRRWRTAGSAPMDAFRIVRHTAHVGFGAIGATRAEAFAHAVQAMKSSVSEEVPLQAPYPKNLLRNWPSELIHLPTTCPARLVRAVPEAFASFRRRFRPASRLAVLLACGLVAACGWLPPPLFAALGLYQVQEIAPTCLCGFLTM